MNTMFLNIVRLTFILIGMVGVAFAASQLPDEPKKIITEPDQTDVYAIPLDEDDQSQEEEVTDFEDYKKSK